MSKVTFILLNHRSAWVGGGESGDRPVLKSLQRIELAEAMTVEEQVAELLGAIQQQRLQKKAVVLVLGPQHAEYRPFQVPPVGPTELPTIVENLASTQMTKIGEGSIIDFVAMPKATSATSDTVLVTATSFHTNLLLDELKAKGVTFERILPRVVLPNLLRDSSGSESQVMINVLGTEIDFVATQADRLVMVRSSVIGAEGEERTKLIGRETARSLAVLAAEFGRLDKMDIAVAGRPEDTNTVANLLQEMDLTTKTVTPVDFGSVPTPFEASQGQYALLALAALRLDRRPLLDFANPTRPPKDDTWKRKLVLGIALAATVVLGLIGWAWLEIRKLDQQLADVEFDVQNLETEEPSNNLTIARIGMINRFVTMDVDPLTLLDSLSTHLPHGDEMRVQGFKLNVGRVSTEESFPVTITSRLSDERLAEEYKPTLQSETPWELDPNTKLSNVKSQYYTKQAVDLLTVTPDFELAYERLLDAILGADPSETSEQEMATPAQVDGDAKNQEMATDDEDRANGDEKKAGDQEETGDTAETGERGDADADAAGDGDADEASTDRQKPTGSQGGESADETEGTDETESTDETEGGEEGEGTKRGEGTEESEGAKESKESEEGEETEEGEEIEESGGGDEAQP